MRTDPARRRVPVAILVGIIAGAVSAIVKFGWEVPLPPRTPERNATNPPQELLQQLGFSESFTHQTYTYLGNQMPWVSFIVHFAFAIGFAIIYCVLAEYFPRIKMGQGVVFGLAVWVVFHLILMPAFGTVPPPWRQPFGEHFSEALGHAVWMWVIEIVRRDLRNRITHEPDAEIGPARSDSRENAPSAA